LPVSDKGRKCLLYRHCGLRFLRHPLPHFLWKTDFSAFIASNVRLMFLTLFVMETLWRRRMTGVSRSAA